jgi:DNA recombination protein RmuC
MDTFLIGLVLFFVFLLLVGVVVLIFLQLRKSKNDSILPAVQQTAAQLGAMQTALAGLNGFLQGKAAEEARTREAIDRLEMVISGTKTKGSAGENLLDVVFSQLPADWQVRNFALSGKTVEFGLKLPNGLILPIDSKWVGTRLIEQFIASTPLEDKQKIKAEIDKAILAKVKEVHKYIEAGLTTSFGIAAVPDSVFEVCHSCQVDAFALGVILCSYSMLIPVLLISIQSSLKNLRSIDLQRLEAYLHAVQGSILGMQDELDGRFAKALTMLSNSRDDMRALVGKANTGLTSLQLGVPQSPALPDQANQ